MLQYKMTATGIPIRDDEGSIAKTIHAAAPNAELITTAIW